MSLATVDLKMSLNHYFNENVTLRREETKKILVRVIGVIHAILDRVNQLDKRFGRSGEAKHTGSYYQGLKVKRADEFDFTIPMTSLPSLVWGNIMEPPRFYGFNRNVEEPQRTVPSDLEVVRKLVPLTPPPEGHKFVRMDNRQLESHCDVMFGLDVIPFLVRRLFKHLVCKAVEDLNLKDNVQVMRVVHGPAITITLMIKVNRIIEVSVDFAPMWESNLQFCDWMGWPRENTKWPSQEKIEKIKAKGINMVAKKDFYWTLSFAECEKELISEIDADGGVRKKCHRVMKSLREDVWCPKGMKQVLTSFHLKNILFWECERLPEGGHWTEERFADRFLEMTSILLDHLRRRNLRMYFYPSVNLFKEKDAADLVEVAKRVEKFLCNPIPDLERVRE